jgi:hypothetical protein
LGFFIAVKYHKNILTKQLKNGIIYIGGENMSEDEYGHKGIDRAVQVDKTIIESNDFRRKFDNATDNRVVNKTLYTSAKEILYDRSGTLYESMIWIDGDTGKIVTKFDSMGKTKKLTGKNHELKVEYGKSVLNKLKGYNNIITLHNHPNSSAPSAGDFNSAKKNCYSIGFVVTHNGRLFKYRSEKIITENLYHVYWLEFVEDGYDEIEAQIKAIEKISETGDIYFTEVMSK